MRISLSCVIILFCLCLNPALAQEIGELDLERIQRATVFILQTRGSDMTIFCVGTGTLVRYDGLILTNAHHTLPSASCPGDTLIIALSTQLDEPPIPKYRAEVVESDEGLDLAVLRITRELDGRLIEPEQFAALPFVELADTTTLELDETLTIVGYPSIGNDAVKTIRSVVSGRILEPSGGWIKVQALEPIAGTMTGGGAYNRLGQLVGIPTTAPTGILTADNCTYLGDTNRDGFINTADNCVALGEFITVLRPADFARRLVRSASLGFQLDLLTIPTIQLTTFESPTIQRLFFSPSVSDGMPTTVIGRLPTGATSLFIFFDYANMTPETVYELRVNIDGIPSQVHSLPPVRWSGGVNGMWYIGSNNQVWPNGTYEFRLFINGLVAATQSITVGGPAQITPAFSTIVFGLLDEQQNLQGNGSVLPTGSVATARFIYQNIPPDTPWTARWLYNGNLLTQVDATWSREYGASGYYPLNIQPEGGFLPGLYRLELYLNGFLSATSDFVVAGQTGGVLPLVFSEPQFFRSDNPQAFPTGNAAQTFPDGANTLYTTLDWQSIAAGTLWTMRWLVDGEVFYEKTIPWNINVSGTGFQVRLTTPNGLPDGTYQLELLVNGILLRSAQVTVGIGQLPIDRFAVPTGIRLQGRVIDTDTQAGIPNATFILLSAEYSVADFTWSREQIYALVTTDAQGYFEIDRPLQLETPYSVVLEVEGYLPMNRDAFEITVEDGNPIEMLIPLTRD